MSFIAFHDELKKLVCNRHRRPIVLNEGEIINKDKTVTKFLSCEKCHLVIEYTKELQEKLEKLVKTLQEEAAQKQTDVGDRDQEKLQQV